MTAAGFPRVSLPEAADDPRAAPDRRPRNFLVARERRRLFWAFMPPALIAVVALELFTRSDGPPGPPPTPQVDTRLEAVAGPVPAADEVIIVPADEPPDVVDERLLSASPTALSRVRDATFFRGADEDAWLESFLTLRGYEGRRLPPPQDVGFTELFGQPKSFRGRSVRMRGTLRRLERLKPPNNNYGIDEYWQGWLEPEGGPASPVVVHFLEVPEGLATGLEIHEPTVVSGCFFKNMAYRAGDGVRVAPLLLARAPVPPALPVVQSGSNWWDLSLAAIGVVTMLAIVGMIAIGFFVGGRGRKSAAPAGDLDQALAGVETVSVAESLRRVAADEAIGGPVFDGDDR